MLALYGDELLSGHRVMFLSSEGPIEGRDLVLRAGQCSGWAVSGASLKAVGCDSMLRSVHCPTGRWRARGASACDAGVIWTMKFSKNGKFLASAGQDAAVRVWEVRARRVALRGGSRSGVA